MTTWAPDYVGVRVYGLLVEARSWQPDGAMFIQRMPEEKEGTLLMSYADLHSLRNEIAHQTDLYHTAKPSHRGAALIDRAAKLEQEWQELGKPDVLADWAAGRRKTGKTEVIRAMAKRYKSCGGAYPHIASLYAPKQGYYSPDDDFPPEGITETELPGLGRDVRAYQVDEERYLSNVKASAHRLADMDDAAPRYELERAALHNADEAFYNARSKAEQAKAAAPDVAQTYAAGDVFQYRVAAEPAVPIPEVPEQLTETELDLMDRHGLTWRKHAKIINDAGEGYYKQWRARQSAEAPPYSIPQFLSEEKLLEGHAGTGKTAATLEPAARYRKWKVMLDTKWERMAEGFEDQFKAMEDRLWALPTEEDQRMTRLGLDKEDRMIGKLGRQIYNFVAPALVVAAWVIACITGAAAFFWLFPG